MSARILSLVALAASTVFSGCTSTKRIYSAEREEGRVTSLDWRIGEKIEATRGMWTPGGSYPEPPVSSGDAIRVANNALNDYVKKTEQWSLAYCRIVELQPDCYAYAVRFDRKGVFEEAQASDRFVKFYVLFDKSVIVPTIGYDR